MFLFRSDKNSGYNGKSGNLQFFSVSMEIFGFFSTEMFIE